MNYRDQAKYYSNIFHSGSGSVVGFVSCFSAALSATTDQRIRFYLFIFYDREESNQRIYFPSSTPLTQSRKLLSCCDHRKNPIKSSETSTENWPRYFYTRNDKTSSRTALLFAHPLPERFSVHCVPLLFTFFFFFYSFFFFSFTTIRFRT